LNDLSALYKQYASDVFKYLMCLCNEKDLSEELTQETFYQAVKSIHRYNGECKMSVWLCQIAKHSYYKYLEKSKKNTQASLDRLPESVTFVTPETEYIFKEGRMAWYRKVHLLKDPYKEVFLLRTLGDLSFKEIGEIQGKTENWARVTFYRAKNKLIEAGDSNE
jgi:RNA polymerase sigma factor (sigma-70 family)